MKMILKTFFPFLLFLGLSACGKDLSLQDWRAEQAAQQAAKFQAVSGTYNGVLLSSGDRGVLGSLSITVEPDSNVQPSQDGTTREISTMIRGKVTYQGSRKLTVNYKDGYYDPRSHVFRATIPVAGINGQTGQIETTPLEIYGDLSSETLSGHFEAKGYDSYGCSFRLTKNGDLNPSNGSKGSATGSGSSESHEFEDSQEYTGVANYRGAPALPSETVSVRLLYRMISPEEQFLSLVTPIRHVVATVSFASGGNPRSYEGTLNKDSESILTSLTQTIGSRRMLSNLNCTRPTAVQWAGAKISTKPEQSWFCVLENDVRGVYWTALLEPTGN